MQILLRITKMAWRYRVRLVLAYVSFFAAIGFALLVPRLSARLWIGWSDLTPSPDASCPYRWTPVRSC